MVNIMTTKITHLACCILISLMCTLWWVKAETPTTTLVSVTSPSHELPVSLKTTEYVSPVYTDVSSLDNTTVTPDLNSSSNSNVTEESMTTSNTLVTKTSPMAESQLPTNGSVALTNFTTSTASTSPSTFNVSETGYTEDITNVTSNTTSHPTQDLSTLQNNNTEVITASKGDFTTPLLDGKNSNLKYSEIILTTIFSTILAIVILAILAFSFNKYRKRRSQYCHHPLRQNSYESGDRFSTPDDTLVISGGLYDAPRIYNPNMTVLEEEEPQNDYISFNSRPGQFRLEFLPGDKEMDPVSSGSFSDASSSQRKNV